MGAEELEGLGVLAGAVEEHDAVHALEVARLNSDGLLGHVDGLVEHVFKLGGLVLVDQLQAVVGLVARAPQVPLQERGLGALGPRLHGDVEHK